jgi:hypothetical protein
VAGNRDARAVSSTRSGRADGSYRVLRSAFCALIVMACAGVTIAMR